MSQVANIAFPSHVHSVMGAFGLNASIMDSANLAWKLGLCARNRAQLSVLGPTYDAERRLHARRIIRVSGSYLRFVCNSDFPLAQFNSEEPKNLPNQPRDAIEYTAGHDLEFLHDFFSTNGQFLLGVDAAYPASCISPARIRTGSARHPPPPIAPRNGVRAPNPRLCLSTSSTGYLYDVLTGAATIHIVLFGSDLQGPIRARLAEFSSLLEAGLPPTKCGPSSSSPSFYLTYGAESLFNIVLVTKCLPHEAEPLLTCSAELAALRARARVVYDDRAPDEDAHTCYEINHAEGAVVVVRPDLWVGTSFYLKDAAAGLDEYFASWLVPLPHGGGGKVDEMEIQLPN